MLLKLTNGDCLGVQVLDKLFYEADFSADTFRLFEHFLAFLRNVTEDIIGQSDDTGQLMEDPHEGVRCHGLVHVSLIPMVNRDGGPT